jgi:hypothetical protein
MSVEETKKAIIGRIHRSTRATPVPEHVIRLFDHVIEETHVEAFLAHPTDKWERIEFWKEEILARIAEPFRGLVAIQYHEYMAAIERGNEESDEELLTALRPSNPCAEAIAQRDAYLACCAAVA